MTGRELDALELDEQRIAVPLELENQAVTDQHIDPTLAMAARRAWVEYLAMAAAWGGGS
jgi:hypothetical protein